MFEGGEFDTGLVFIGADADECADAVDVQVDVPRTATPPPPAQACGPREAGFAAMPAAFRECPHRRAVCRDRTDEINFGQTDDGSYRMDTGISERGLEELVVAGGGVEGGGIAVVDGGLPDAPCLSGGVDGCGEFTALRVPTGQTARFVDVLLVEREWEALWAARFRAAA